MLLAITNKIKTFKSPLNLKDLPKHMDPNNVVPTNRRAPPLDVGELTKIDAM